MTEYAYTTDWFSPWIEQWERFTKHLDGTPCRLLEIGSFEGRSAVWMLENLCSHPASTLTCIDGWEFGGEQAFDFNTLQTRRARHLKKYKAKSSDALPLLRHARYDLAYIDGSHEARDFLVDWHLTYPLVKPGGIIIIDDYDGDYEKPQEYSAPVLVSPRAAMDVIVEAWGSCTELLYRDYQIILKKCT